MTNAANLKQAIDDLRQRSEQASSSELDGYLSEARELLKQAFQTDAESAARRLFRDLRDRRSGSATVVEATTVSDARDDFMVKRDALARRIQSERMRLHGGGSLADMETAVDGLYAVLRELGPLPEENADSGPATDKEWRFRHRLLRADVLETLQEAATRAPQLRQRVVELLETPDIAVSSDVQAVLKQLGVASPGEDEAADTHADENTLSADPDSGVDTDDMTTPTVPADTPGTADTPAPPPAKPPAAPVHQTPPSEVTPTRPVAAAMADETTAQLASANRLFYAGDYYEAIEAYTDLLRIDPDNAEASERLKQVETNLQRGIVPDRRVPFEARAAFGRAQSLERAGRFEEARSAYTIALKEARKGGPLLENWYPAVEALTRVETSIVAQETRVEADRILREDRWEDAMIQYDAVLNVLPEDGYAKERRAMLDELINGAEEVNQRLAAVAADPAAAGAAASDFVKTLRRLRPKFSGSARFAALANDVNAQINETLLARLAQRSDQLLARADSANNAGERRRYTAEAVTMLEQLLSLAPEDEAGLARLEGARQRLAALGDLDESLSQARTLMDQGDETRLYQARDVLLGAAAGDHDNEPALRQVMGALQRQFLMRARDAVEQGRYRPARQLVHVAQAAPFERLGTPDEAADILEDIRQAEAGQRNTRILQVVGGGIVVLLLIGALAATPFLIGNLARPEASPTVNPVLLTEQAVEPTIAPSLTPQPEPTNTTIPTATPQPTATVSPTPAIAPSPTPRIGAVNVDTAARLEPDPISPWAFTLRAADPVQVLQEDFDEDGRLWYKILYVRGTSTLIGWALGDEVNVQQPPDN